MKLTSEPVSWECAECGTRCEASFGTSLFFCPACGYEASGEDAIATYKEIRKTFLAKVDLHVWNLCPFEHAGNDIPVSLHKRIAENCTYLVTPSYWTDVSWFDVLWIMHGNPDLAVDLPLQTISDHQWFRFRDISDSPFVIFVTAVACKDDDGVSFQSAALSWEERILSIFGWSRWTKVQREKIARRLHDSVISCSKISVIPSFSFETQLNLWRIDPTTPEINITSLVPLFDPTDAVSAISSNLLKTDILESVQLDSWKPCDWLALLRKPHLTLPEKAKKEIKLRWKGFCWSAETLSNLIEQNDEARRVFPELPSSMMAEMLSLHPDFATWMSKEGWFDRLSSQDWMPLLANEAVFLQKPVRDYAAKAVLPGLSCADREELIRNNLGIAVFYPAASLSESTLVELYVSGRHDDYFQSNGFSFSGLSVDSWISLLARCGKRVPVETAGFFLKESGRLETPTIEKLLTKNSQLLPFLSKDQISRLTTETFLHFSKKTGAPDFLVSAYPVQKWTQESQRDFLKAYPWTEKYFDWKTWPIRQIDNLIQDNWMLEKAYPHKLRLFSFRYRKLITVAISAFALSLGLLTLAKSAPILREAQLSRERENAKEHDAIIAAEERAKAEANARERASEASRAENARQKAELECETQLSRERENAKKDEASIAADERAKAEAEAIKAKSDADHAESERQKAEIERETQLSRERENAKNKEASIAADKRARAEEEARKAQADAEREKAATAKSEAEAQSLTASVEKLKIEVEIRERFKKLSEAVLESLMRGDTRSARKHLKEIDTDAKKANATWFNAASKFIGKMEKANAGDAESAVWIGEEFATETNVVVIKDDTIAFDWFNKAAKGGNAIAMRSLGVFYKEGRGCKKNETKAFEWYRKSFDAGDSTAGFYLGNLYLRGIGIGKSSEKAFSTYEKAAEMGSPNARYMMGRLLYYGEGCEMDRYTAVSEIRKAKRDGSTLSNMDWLLK